MSIWDQFSLKGKVAVVTGGTGVLGGAMARGLAAAGARVGVLGRRAEKAQEVADDIRAAGGTAMPLPADVLDEASLHGARQMVLDAWGQVDVLVNAAGGNRPLQHFKNSSEELSTSMFETRSSPPTHNHVVQTSCYLMY